MAERRDDPGALVGRAIESLRALPPVEGEAVAQIVAAAARTRAQDAEPNEDDLLPLTAGGVDSGARRRLIIGAAAAVVLAVAGLGVWRAAKPSDTFVASRTNAPSSSLNAVVRPVSAAADRSEDAALIPTQFVFDGVRARRVMLVGDFNNWDERATPLEHEPGSSLWSVTVPIQRGRHIYAFFVDSIWTIDKRAPVARDPDFGVTGSVILVGRP